MLYFKRAIKPDFQRTCTHLFKAVTLPFNLPHSSKTKYWGELVSEYGLPLIRDGDIFYLSPRSQFIWKLAQMSRKRILDVFSSPLRSVILSKSLWLPSRFLRWSSQIETSVSFPRFIVESDPETTEGERWLIGGCTAQIFYKSKNSQICFLLRSGQNFVAILVRKASRSIGFQE